MATKDNNAAVLWTGGKDSALALYRARAGGASVGRLVTFAPPDAKFLAHSLPVMALQAQALGLPHQVVEITPPHEASYRRAIGRLRDEGVRTVVTGDIDLVDGLPNFVRQCCQGLDVAVSMPLWQAGRRGLLDEMLAAGFEIIMSLVKAPWFTPDWAGRRIDAATIAEMEMLRSRNGLDICGENGEYHSLVLGGPGFAGRIELTTGPAITQDEMTYINIRRADLRP